MNFEKFSGGYYQVESKKFISKFEALKYANEINKPIKFVYFDNAFNSVNKSFLGRQNLNNLYKQRAQQLRDEYDYLILYFSGGADSYNVLRSFIDNNIKLDEVCVRWPMIAVDKKFYNPNTQDASSFNFLSEWDYAVKPVLENLKQYHPNIKITVVDWTEDFTPAVYNENLMIKIGIWNDVEMPMLMSYSNSENLFLDKGKKVASIFGVDKPIVGYDDTKWYMGFTDHALGMGIPQHQDANNIEYFYWTPKMPEIAFEQAYVVCQYLEQHQHLTKFFYSQDTDLSKDTFIEMTALQNDLMKSLIYTTWTGVFQASKPVCFDRADKNFWIFERPEFVKHRDSFIDLNSLALSQVDANYTRIEKNGVQIKNKVRGIFGVLRSKWHFVKLKECRY
jgi:hypothetical protein